MSAVLAEIDVNGMTSSPFSMVSFEQIAPGRLRDAKQGSLFIAFPDEATPWVTEPYLSGDINGTDVRVSLRGEIPFHVNQPKSLPNQAGFSIAGINIEVDRGSAVYRRTEEDCKTGEIIIHPQGCSLIATDGHQKHIVDLMGNKLDPVAGVILIAFSRWEIATSGARHQVFYHYTGKELLLGPYDPEIDDPE
jgi:hypothetical protein